MPQKNPSLLVSIRVFIILLSYLIAQETAAAFPLIISAQLLANQSRQEKTAKDTLKVQHVIVGGGLLLLYTKHLLLPEWRRSQPPLVKICSGAARLTIAALTCLSFEGYKRLKALPYIAQHTSPPRAKIISMLQYYTFLKIGIPGAMGMISGTIDHFNIR